MECAKSSSDISIRNFKVPHTFPKCCFYLTKPKPLKYIFQNHVRDIIWEALVLSLELLFDLSWTHLHIEYASMVSGLSKNPLLCVRTITPRSLEVLEGKLTVLPVLKWIILRCIGSAQNYCKPSYDTALFLTAIHERLAGFCRSLMNPDAIEPLHLSRSVVKLMVKKYSLRYRKLWPNKRRKSPTVRSTIFV